MSYYYNHFNEIIVSADMFPDPHELRLQWEIAKIDERIKTNEAEISRLRNVIEEAQNRINTGTSEINSLHEKKNWFVEDLSSPKENKKQIDWRPDFVVLLPRMRPGKQPREYLGSASKRSLKQERDALLVGELKRRQAENPKLPITSGANPEQTHANNLAKELKGWGIPRVGYSTIRNGWKNRDKN